MDVLKKDNAIPEKGQMKNQSVTIVIFDKQGHVITKLYNRNWSVRMKKRIRLK